MSGRRAGHRVGGEAAQALPFQVGPPCACREQPQALPVTKALTLAGHSEQQLRPVSQRFRNAGCVQALCDVPRT